ncbi:MAG: flagellar hook-associated family protein [Hyphomicrobiaceae bacterium]
MTSTFIASSAVSGALRSSLMKLQAKLAEAQKEVATGRLADVGLSLGFKAGQTVSLRQEHSRLQSITDSNGLVASRLDASQAALKAFAEGAQSFLGQLVVARNSDTAAATIEGQAKAALAGFTDLANTTFNGVALFAGINTDVKPITDYASSPPAANALAVANAFTTAFGISQSNAAVASITPAAMQTFLDGAFANLFDPTAWSGTWSAAADQNTKSRISTSELVETSVNANDEAFRKLASAYTMLADLGTANLSQTTYQAIVDKATLVVGDALQGITALQAKLGSVQERVKNADTRMGIEIDIMTSHIGALEGVDPYEASSRLSTLLTQVETAYAMTARIQQLTLLNYLPTR